MKIIVVGAGIVGASCAYHLMRDGHDVTVIDAGPAGGRASADAFGWINASFSETPEYYKLRRAAIDGFAEVSKAEGLPSVRWQGALWFEDAGADFDDQLTQMRDFGYEVSLLDQAEFRALEPHVANPPLRAVLGHVEGAAQGDEIARALLTASGATVITGCQVIAAEQGRIETDRGTMQADKIVVATGAGTAALTGLPMDNQRGVMLHTKPLKPVLEHIIMAPGCHFRQAPDGRIVMGGMFSGGGFEDVATQDLGAHMLKVLQKWLPVTALEVDQLRFGLRPVPADGLPAIGEWRGVYIATMHSGITLGPLVGQLVAKEISGHQQEMLATFRPERLKSFTRLTPDSR